MNKAAGEKTMTSVCPKEREWCRGLTAITSVLTLVVVVQSVAVAAQAGRIAQMESKNDTIVELKTDMRHVKDNLNEIKQLLRSRQ
jgi:hypothetical protein